MKNRRYCLHIALSCLVLCGTAKAHNGQVALAVPVEGISVDGELEDWPVGAEEYAIEVEGYGDALKGEGDFRGAFRIGYSARENALYIAVEVEDESTMAVSGTDPQVWDIQDGCEVYIDLEHLDRESPVVQFAAYGDARSMIEVHESKSIRTRLENATLASGGEGRVRRYEWRIDIGGMSQGKIALRPGMSLGVDVALCDRDEDGSFSWISWGDGISKLNATDRRGDVVLVGERTKLSRMEGRVLWESEEEDVFAGKVKVQSLDFPELCIQVDTDASGFYEVIVPRGDYEVGIGGSRVEGEKITVAVEGPEVSLEPLRVRPIRGLTAPAGRGESVTARAGVRQDVWHVLGTMDGLPSSVLFDVFQDHRGHLWIGTENGVSRYDGITFTTFTTEDGLAHDLVYAIAEDRNGNLWFGTRGGGISRYDGAEFTTFTTEDGLAHDNVLALLVDWDGRLWIGTEGGGVSRYDGKRFTRFTTRDGLGADEVWAIWEDAKGDLWFGTEGGGVSRYDGAEFTTFTTEDGLGHNWIRAIGEDGEGDLWFGTYGGGVSRYDGRSFETFTAEDGLGDDWVYAITMDQRGGMWFGTHAGGAACYDDGRFSTYTTENGLAHDWVYAIEEDFEGHLWFGTVGGLCRYSGVIFATFTEEDGLGGNEVLAIAEDSRGDLWLGTNGGVSRYDGEDFSTFTEEDGLVNNRVLAIAEDGRGRLWFGTDGGGISRFEDGHFNTITTRDGLADNRVRSIFEDREGDLWFGTDGGVSRYDGEGWPSDPADLTDLRFSTFTEEDGLVNNWVQAIAEDDRGGLWFGTNGGGISRFDGAVFQTLLRRDGLRSNAIHCILQNGVGDIWIATSGGATRYRPHYTAPLVQITDVMTERRHGPVDRIEMSTSQDYLAFEFHCTSFKTLPEAQVYRFRLEGYDQDWRTTHAHRAEYFDLPRGYYTFQVQAVDRDLTYSKEAARVEVHVHLPYGQIGLLSTLSFALILIVVQAWRIVNRDSKLRESNAALGTANRELHEKTAALEDANLEVERATRAKSRFLTSMSHELRTPMNAIMGFTELLQGNREENLSPRQLRNLNTIHRNGGDLLILINQLLDLSKIEAGRVEVTTEMFQVHELVLECMGMAESLLNGKSVELRCSSASDLPVINTDRNKVKQILVNLLSNAVKFTENGWIEVSVWREGNEVSFAVQDTGPGIPEEKLGHIFEEFQQVSSEDSGTGLGLAITVQLCHLLGGKIEVESQPGEGATFTVSLPLEYSPGAGG